VEANAGDVWNVIVCGAMRAYSNRLSLHVRRRLDGSGRSLLGHVMSEGFPAVAAVAVVNWCSLRNGGARVPVWSARHKTMAEGLGRLTAKPSAGTSCLPTGATAA
jgi:hypothetical protein